MVVLDRFFSFEGQKKVVAGRIRQVVVVLYTYCNACMGIGLGGADPALVAAGKWASYRGGSISRFDSVMFALNLACNRNKLFKTLDH